MSELVIIKGARTAVSVSGNVVIPAAIADAGEHAVRRFLEFFSATIRNRNTREAYYRAACTFFAWLEQHQIGGLVDIESISSRCTSIYIYIETLLATTAKPTVKQHLAAIRMLFDWLVDLRDRALIAVMTYAFARIGAVIGMRVEDYYPEGKRWWVRLHEKGGKRHEMPAHHKLVPYLDAYAKGAGIADDGRGPLFRSAAGRTGVLILTPMNRVDAYRMIRRRTVEAGLKGKLGCHVFRATGITAYLEAGGSLENAEAMAAHESPRTTKLYDRTGDEITLDEVERIRI